MVGGKTGNREYFPGTGEDVQSTCGDKWNGRRGEIEDGANEPQQEQQPLSIRQAYHLTFSEEETERWEDAEEEEGSGEHGEEKPE
ncbi:hypothetical protein OUZ56_016300 [Daphnia magna]|uniref:Uncharacterized protein n=1 Tax=Daphnia magna TaxID=35525 RepID=A0ABR0AQC5_9CRUS|nr:hypothetical protein OUZ56_016300 [Daphnia magna]